MADQRRAWDDSGVSDDRVEELSSGFSSSEVLLSTILQRLR